MGPKLFRPGLDISMMCCVCICSKCKNLCNEQWSFRRRAWLRQMLWSSLGFDCRCTVSLRQKCHCWGGRGFLAAFIDSQCMAFFTNLGYHGYPETAWSCGNLIHRGQYSTCNFAPGRLAVSALTMPCWHTFSYQALLSLRASGSCQASNQGRLPFFAAIEWLLVLSRWLQERRDEHRKASRQPTRGVSRRRGMREDSNGQEVPEEERSLLRLAHHSITSQP